MTRRSVMPLSFSLRNPPTLRLASQISSVGCQFAGFGRECATGDIVTLVSDGFLIRQPMPHSSGAERSPTLLILSQVYVPDPASVGQHVADVAHEMARRGFRVVVATSARGYDNPSIRYSSHEDNTGVKVLRIPLASFGKRTLFSRVIATASFMVQCLLIGLTVRNLSGVLFSTSPPLVGAVASLIGWIRRVPLAYWAMDLNPDQLVALGKIRHGSVIERSLEGVNRLILRRATMVVALDRFMARRLGERAPLRHKMLVIPPWPHQTHIRPIEPAANPFLESYGLRGRFVVMYSGNHSMSNPLDTLLQAARELRDDPDVAFVFIGGGTNKAEVTNFADTYGLKNVLSLPYQPLGQLSYSLSAADVHIVSLGPLMAGVIHPCKIYGAMAAQRPVIYIGPSESHISDLLDRFGFGVHVDHGNVQGMVAAIRQMRSAAVAGDRTMALASSSALDSDLNQTVLRGRLCDALQNVLMHRPFLRYTAPTSDTERSAPPSGDHRMRIAITGGTGFIGSYFRKAFAAAGHDVVLLDAHLPANDPAKAIHGDVRDVAALKSAFAGCNAVLHLAAAHHDFGIPREMYFDVNENGTRAVCQVADECGITNLCFYSSVAVFGDLPGAPDETTNPQPVSPYGQSKLAAEEVFKTWTRTGGGRSCLVIRPTVTFGPGNYANMYSLIRQIHTGRFLPIGRGDNIKSLAYVENIVDATLFLWNLGGRPRFTEAADPAGAFEVFNYIDKPDLTSRQIVEICYRSLGKKAPRFRVPLSLAVVAGLPFDLAIKVTGKNLPISTARMKKLCTQTLFGADKVLRAGFRPAVSLEEGIDRMARWYLTEGVYTKPGNSGGSD